MRTTNLSFPLAATMALAIALLSISCGKDNKDKANKVGTKGLQKSQGGTPSGGGDNGNTISGGQIVVIKEIVFKTGDLTTPYTGHVIWKHDNGKRQMESFCEAGVWNGPSKWWFKNDNLAGEGTYKNGKWDGNYKEWHENGKPKVQVTFKDGKEEGKEIWWYENGKIRSVTIFKTGKKEGKAEGYFENGIKSWAAGWVSNVPDGEYWEWYDNGDKKSVLRYAKGRRHGKEEHWYKKSNKSSDEQKAWEVTWANNKKQGRHNEWYPSGIPMKWMTYEKGVMHGEAGSHYENGKPASQRMYQNGKETYRRQWDAQGKLIADGPPPQPQGRTHQWTQKTITDYCKGKAAADIEKTFGKADGAGPGGTWVYRGLKFLNTQTNQPFTATVQFAFTSGMVSQTKIATQ